MVNATPLLIYPRERPVTHCIGGWVGPRAGLDGCGKSRHPPRFDPRTVQPVAEVNSAYRNVPKRTGTSRSIHLTFLQPSYLSLVVASYSFSVFQMYFSQQVPLHKTCLCTRIPLHPDPSHLLNSCIVDFITETNVTG